MNWQLIGIVGWILVLIGWLLQRPSVQNRISNFNFQIGSGNQSSVTQVQTNSADAAGSKGGSVLSQIGSWTGIVGLVLTVYPLFK